MARTKQTARRNADGTIGKKQDRGSKTARRAGSSLVKSVVRTPQRKSAIAKPAEKKARRYRPGTRAEWEIRRQQKSTEDCIPKAPLNRLAREIADQQETLHGKRWSAKAQEAIHAAIEAYIVDLMQASNIVALNAGAQPCKTLLKRHMQTATDVAARYPGVAIDRSIKQRQAYQEEYDRQKAHNKAVREQRKHKTAPTASSIKKKQSAPTSDETTTGDAQDDEQGEIPAGEEQEEEEEAAQPVVKPFVIKRSRKSAANKTAAADDEQMAVESPTY
jgi:histone H3/H4